MVRCAWVNGRGLGSTLDSLYHALLQNYPNPFNAQTTISYELPERGRVRLVVYTLTGQVVRVLVDGIKEAGRHSALWDGRDEGGAQVGAGVYLCEIEVGGFREGRRLVLLR